MFQKFYKNNLDKYIFENITFRFITTISYFVDCVFSLVLSTRINAQKVVFMPPKVITQEMWVTGSEVSKSYLEEMGQFVAFNLLNITKHNAKAISTTLCLLLKLNITIRSKASYCSNRIYHQ